MYGIRAEAVEPFHYVQAYTIQDKVIELLHGVCDSLNNVNTFDEK
jgi:hypothetical protein